MEVRNDVAFWLTLPFAVVCWLASTQQLVLVPVAVIITLAVVFPKAAKAIGAWLVGKINLRFASVPTTAQRVVLVATAVLAAVGVGAMLHAQQPDADRMFDYQAAAFLLIVAFVMLNTTAWLNRRQANRPRAGKKRPSHLKVVRR